MARSSRWGVFRTVEATRRNKPRISHNDFSAAVRAPYEEAVEMLECIEIGTVSQGRTKKEAMENLRILTKGHLEIEEENNKILAERLGNN